MGLFNGLYKKIDRQLVITSLTNLRTVAKHLKKKDPKSNVEQYIDDLEDKFADLLYLR